ncbi:MAG: LysM peptidoglycan-binding domain-containing protein [Mucilaginibacter polytrichastri]|nr:LysM peptidoglycan-binding domain-containing protein [Mucilaginibacter polytrichastri]
MTSKLYLFLFFTLFSIPAFATYRDSTGVENLDGKKLIIHQVDAKETYYGIARKYNVPPKTVIEYNKNTPLHVGSVVKVPTDRPFVEPVATQSAPKVTENERDQGIIEYKVSSNETFFSIAKRFNNRVDDLVALNNMQGKKLSAGQIIKVRQNGTPPPPPAEVVKRDSTSVAATGDSSDADTPSLPPNKYGLFEKKEKGVCVAIDDPSMDAKKKLALHRSAPIGTIIKITNPMTNRVDFAKVVGRFTENETTKDVILVVTKNVSDALGALDKRFQVQLSYGSPSNEE